MDVITPQDFPPGYISKLPQTKRKSGGRHTQNQPTYKNKIIAFDIETTRLTPEYSNQFAGKLKKNHVGIMQDDGSGERAIMWVWMMHFHGDFTVVGRTWEELRELLTQMESELKPSEGIIMYVHNLSYEFQFLRAIHDFAPDEVFAVKSRKILKCNIGKIELRCSYLLTNMSLAQFTNKMDVEHKKLVGDLDYSKIRFPWTEIQPDELPYCLNDVIGLCEGIEKLMERDGDNLTTIPLTSTGYVRRDLKRAMYWDSRYIRQKLPCYEIFVMLREAFAGGDTHANRYYVGQILENVKSADRSSSYPEVQCNHDFPVGDWSMVADRRCNADYYNRLIGLNKAIVARVAFWGVELADIYEGCPYISSSHCRYLVNPVLDNGRILSADYFEITATDVDLRIITEQYTSTATKILSMAYSTYGKLPKSMTDCVKKYYRDKTELKNVEGQDLYYDKAKALLNSIYGCTAQNGAKPELQFVNGEFVPTADTERQRYEEWTETAVLSYAFGVWTTAWARWELHEGIKCVGAHNFVYCDTDSVKYVGDGDFTAYNANKIAVSTANGAMATDPLEVTHYMGVFEEEHTYIRFCALGAKKYAYQYEDGKTHTTIAGVNKKTGGTELDRQGGIKTFAHAIDTPFTFEESGGTEIRYHDNTEPYILDGRRAEITPNAVIRPSTYTLGLTEEYEQLLEDIKHIDLWSCNDEYLHK